MDDWVKTLAPSTTLRKWYDHDPKKWPEFQRRYGQELSLLQTDIETLAVAAHNKQLTFVFAAKDEARNSAVVLKNYLETRYNIKSD